MSAIDDLQKQRASLVEARNTGALRTTFRDGGSERTVEYKSDRDMAAAIASIDRDIASLQGRRVREIYPVLHKGV